MVFCSGAPPQIVFIGDVIVAVAPALLVLAGLWLADGRRRGALLAVSIHAIQLSGSSRASGGPCAGSSAAILRLHRPHESTQGST